MKCKGKKKYATREDAAAAEGFLSSKGVADLQVYRCRRCNKFHVGTRYKTGRRL